MRIILFLLIFFCNFNKEIEQKEKEIRIDYSVRLKILCNIPVTEEWSCKMKCKYSEQIKNTIKRLDENIKKR